MTNDQQFVIEVAKLFTICVGIITFGATIVGSIAFCRTEKGAAKTFSLLMQRASALQMLTVLIIIMVTFVLAVLGTIKPESVVAILSGIAGYVLGGTARSRQGDSEAEGSPLTKA